jgi:hypothetical protein
MVLHTRNTLVYDIHNTEECDTKNSFNHNHVLKIGVGPQPHSIYLRAVKMLAPNTALAIRTMRLLG